PLDPMRDSSPRGNHGKLRGQATVTNAVLPVIVFGKITGPGGSPVERASVEVDSPNREKRIIQADATGEYAFTLPPWEQCNLLVTAGEFFAYRMNFQPASASGAASPSAVPGASPSNGLAAPKRSEGGRQQLDWTLTEKRRTSSVAGEVVGRVITDDQGKFSFGYPRRGDYQVRAQVPGGRVWLHGGR